MYQGKKVSVVFPVYNEEKNIRKAIEEFFATGLVDEIVAVDNNSKDGSSTEIKASKATYVFETRQGYGAALQRGMREATGDLIVTVEPDGTFSARDLEKLLIYSLDFPVVIGTRTARSLVGAGANMGWLLRMGNIVVAKLLGCLFRGTTLTDVGCTFKLIHRDALLKIQDKFTVAGSHFSPEFMIRVLSAGIPMVEIPVHYGERIGESKITGKLDKAAKLGFRMIRFIIQEWFVWKTKKTQS
ncbi:MAG: glycosyltransferase family 2 protein [Candidatus Magasanikbacteria bacterium]|nr:glycosyltransferase family 2 protein [Candidatus Magasanikbacteria bacterium]